MSIGSCLFVLLLTFGCLFYTASVHTALAEGVVLCLEVILPSLYAMMIAAQLLIQTNASMLLLRPFRWISEKILRMPEVCLAIFLLSQIAGYPVGSRLLDDQMQNGILDQKQASVLAGICFGSGPSFLFGTLSPLVGTVGCWLLFCSTFLSNSILLILFSRQLRLSKSPPISIQRLSAQAFVETVTQSGVALLKLCAMILFFRCLLAIAQASSVSVWLAAPFRLLVSEEETEKLLFAFLEVTALTQWVPHTALQLSIFAALLSFGGICVHLQIAAITGGRLSLVRMFLMRLLAAGLSALLCRIGFFFFPEIPLQQNILRPTVATLEIRSSPTPMASLFLIFAVLLLWQTAAKQQQLCSASESGK